MKIISHRGYWKDLEEKNQFIAFERSFKLGFGTETDIRDYQGELVISHDIADKSSLKLEILFELYHKINPTLPLALNVKADGLQCKLKELLNKYEINNYFLFDMSIPECLQYVRQGFNIYTRQSEYEINPSFFNEANGIWLDEFHGHWINKEIIQHYNISKKICIVSPDLHKRDYYETWNDYKLIEKELNTDKIAICTDYPEEAKIFFENK